MRDFVIKWAVNIIALFAVIHTVAGVSADNWQTVIVAALILGLLNVFLKPIIVVLTLPFNILTLGSFTLIINGFMLYLAAKFVKGFAVANFRSAFWAALLFSVISFLLNMMLTPKVDAKFYSARLDGGSRRRKDEDVIDVEGRVED